jgi:hypothetical protein
LTAVWQGSEGGGSRVIAAPLDGGPSVASLEGQLPAAASVGDRIVYAFVTRNGDRRAVSVATAGR